jgi:hypothetical protein
MGYGAEALPGHQPLLLYRRKPYSTESVRKVFSEVCSPRGMRSAQSTIPCGRAD